MGIKTLIIINGKEYKPMKIGIPVNLDTDVRFEGNWYTCDTRQQREDN